MALKKKKFLAAFARIGTVLHAAKAVGVGRRTVQGWQKQDTAFLAAYQDAQEEAVEMLEQEAQRRAVKGVAEPVFYQGVQCGTVQKYSDTLLIFLLNAARPEKYRANQSKEVGDGNVTIIIQQFSAPKQIEPKIIRTAIEAPPE